MPNVQTADISNDDDCNRHNNVYVAACRHSIAIEGVHSVHWMNAEQTATPQLGLHCVQKKNTHSSFLL